jgi:hypothetical protein
MTNSSLALPYDTLLEIREHVAKITDGDLH